MSMARDWRGRDVKIGSRVQYCGPEFAFWQGTVTEMIFNSLYVLRDGDSYPRVCRPWHVVVIDDEETQHDI